MSDSSNGERSGGTGRGDDASQGDGTESGLFGGRSLAYRAVMIGVAGIGIVAIAAGLAGTFVALTGGFDGGEEFDVLGEYECDTFDADPGVVHESDYEIQRQVLDPSEVSEFDGSTTDEGLSLTLETNGVLLAASANEPDGRPIDVGVDRDDDRVLLERETTEPFRLWVDSVAEDGTVTRMQLDICPPQ